MATHLERLLFAQGGRCFFCGDELSKPDASVEHLVAQAKSAAFPAGGSSHDDNCVACCKALNHLLGSKPLKEKFAIVLAQQGRFRCPSKTTYAKDEAADTYPSLIDAAAIGPDLAPSPLATVRADTTLLADQGVASPPSALLSAGSDGNVQPSGVTCTSPTLVCSSPPTETDATEPVRSSAPADDDRRMSIADARPDEWPAMLLARLENSPNNRPAKLVSLRNYIRASLTPHAPTEAMVSKVVQRLSSMGVLNVIGEKVYYGFADAQVKASPSEWRVKVVESLIKAGKAKPRKTKTLAAFAGATLTAHKPTPAEIIGVVNALRTRGYVLVEGDQVRYKLPKSGASA